MISSVQLTILLVVIATFLLSVYLLAMVLLARNEHKVLIERIARLEMMHHSRMGTLKKMATTAVPPQDHARTTRRDTHDIPARGGRMSTALHRVRNDRASESDDGQLHERSGPEAARDR
jgi:type II secretory pathway component PulJ